MEPYFQKIEKLIDKHRSEYRQDNSGDRLLTKKENSSGAVRVQACFDLFIHYIYKSTELAKQYNDEAYQLSADSGYNEGLLTASLNQAYILFVQGEFDASMALILKVESDKQLSQYPKTEVNCATLKSYIFTERGEYDIALDNAVNLLERGAVKACQLDVKSGFHDHSNDLHA